MEFRVSINEKAVFVLLVITAIVSAIGITMAAPPDPGHSWNEIECVGCIETANLADGSVTSDKADFNYAGSDSQGGNATIAELANSVDWSDISNIPADIANGDQDTLPPSCSWTGWQKTFAGQASCSYGCAAYSTVLELYCSGNRITNSRTASACISCNSGGGFCFVAETRVTMADGTLKSIEDIQAGDRVNGRESVNEVLGINSHPVRSGIIYSINSKVEFTGDHPFLTKDGVWKVINPEQYDKNP
jgi:hypothetical protein